VAFADEMVARAEVPSAPNKEDHKLLIELGLEYLQILGREEAEFHGAALEEQLGAKITLHPLLGPLRHLVSVQPLGPEKRQKVTFPDTTLLDRYLDQIHPETAEEQATLAATRTSSTTAEKKGKRGLRGRASTTAPQVGESMNDDIVTLEPKGKRQRASSAAKSTAANPTVPAALEKQKKAKLLEKIKTLRTLEYFQKWSVRDLLQQKSICVSRGSNSFGSRICAFYSQGRFYCYNSDPELCNTSGITRDSKNGSTVSWAQPLASFAKTHACVHTQKHESHCLCCMLVFHHVNII